MFISSNNQTGSTALGIIVAIVITAVLVGGGIYYWQSQQVSSKSKEADQQVQGYQNQVSDLQQQLTDKDKQLADQAQKEAEAALVWLPYTSSNYNLSFFYPKDWNIYDQVAQADLPNAYVGIGLTPPNMTGDFQWGIQVFKSSDTTADKLIADIGKQFADRQVAKEKITLDGVSAIKVTVTSSSTPDWFSQTVIATKNSKIYEIGNGAIRDDKFQTFYQSIVLP